MKLASILINILSSICNASSNVVRVDGDDATADDGLPSPDKTPAAGGGGFSAVKVFAATGCVVNCR